VIRTPQAPLVHRCRLRLNVTKQVAVLDQRIGGERFIQYSSRANWGLAAIRLIVRPMLIHASQKESRCEDSSWRIESVRSAKPATCPGPQLHSFPFLLVDERSLPKPRSVFSQGPKSQCASRRPSRCMVTMNICELSADSICNGSIRVQSGDECVGQLDLTLALASSSTSSHPAPSCAGRTAKPPSCDAFMVRSCSRNCCFCSLGSTSILFCTGSGRCRAMTSDLSVVAISSSAACGVPPCKPRNAMRFQTRVLQEAMALHKAVNRQTPNGCC